MSKKGNSLYPLATPKMSKKRAGGAYTHAALALDEMGKNGCILTSKKYP